MSGWEGPCKKCGGTGMVRARKGKRAYVKPRGNAFGRWGGIAVPVHSIRVYYRQGAGRNGRYHACPACTSPQTTFEMLEQMAKEARNRGKVPYVGINLHDHPVELEERRKVKAQAEKGRQAKTRR